MTPKTTEALLRECHLLAELSRQFGQEPEKELEQRISKLKQQLESENKKKKIGSIAESIKTTKKSSLEESISQISPVQIVVEQTQTEILPDDIVADVCSVLSNVVLKEEVETSGSITRRISAIETFLRNMPASGSGGGSGSLVDIDARCVTVTSDSYEVGRKDYYIGVNYNGQCTITLPEFSVKTGRRLVIKDESGLAGINSIVIVGTVDNDPTGAELKINNGSLTLIFNNGWRVI